MKKVLALTFALVMSVLAFTGCGSDPVADDFEKFLNTDMVSVNEKYEEIKSEITVWQSAESDEAMLQITKENVIPRIDEAIALLDEVQPATDEVKELKAKFAAMLDKYKEGFELVVTALETADESVLTEGAAKIDEGIALLDEYNAGLESLAEQCGMTIEY